MNRLLSRLLSGFLLGVVLCACSNVRSDEFSKRVMTATPQQLAKIQAGLEKGLTLHPVAYAIKSQDFANAYYIAARLQGAGVDEYAAWCLSGNPEADSGMILSADSVAAQFSQWPKGSTTKMNAWITDPDCSGLLDYAKDKK